MNVGAWGVVVAALNVGASALNWLVGSYHAAGLNMVLALLVAIVVMGWHE